MDENNLERKRFISPSPLRSYIITKRRQGRNLGAELKAEKAVEEWLLGCSFSMTCSSWLHRVNWTLLHQSLVKTIPHKLAYRLIFMKSLFQLRSLFTDTYKFVSGWQSPNSTLTALKNYFSFGCVIKNDEADFTEYWEFPSTEDKYGRIFVELAFLRKELIESQIMC